MLDWLTLLQGIAIFVEAVCVTAVFVIGADLAWYYYKGYSRETQAIKMRQQEQAQLRKKKEETATGGFFEESFVVGFNGTGELLYRGEHRYPREDDEVWRACRKLDELADAKIFRNTEEL